MKWLYLLMWTTACTTAQPAPSGPPADKPGAPITLLDDAHVQPGEHLLRISVDAPVDSLQLTVSDGDTRLAEVRRDEVRAHTTIALPIVIPDGPRRWVRVSAQTTSGAEVARRSLALVVSPDGRTAAPVRPTSTDPKGRRILTVPASTVGAK